MPPRLGLRHATGIVQEICVMDGWNGVRPVNEDEMR